MLFVQVPAVPVYMAFKDGSYRWPPEGPVEHVDVAHDGWSHIYGRVRSGKSAALRLFVEVTAALRFAKDDLIRVASDLVVLDTSVVTAVLRLTSLNHPVAPAEPGSPTAVPKPVPWPWAGDARWGGVAAWTGILALIITVVSLFRPT